MKRYFLLKTFFLLILSLGGLKAQSTNDAYTFKGRQKTLWKGFDRYDFQFEQRDTRLIVPDNPLPLINKYIQLGGIATVVPCTKGEQKLYGHHFQIETPRLVADFIKYHSLQDIVLDTSYYHTLRGGLQNSRIKFENDKKGRVAFLGGSITYNTGWRDSIEIYLTRRFPETEFEFIAAGIPSMGTTPASFRLERDVLSHGKIDLLFEEAAVNDASNGRTSKEQIRAMEGIIRHLLISNPDIDIVMMHFVDPEKIESYRKNEEPTVIRNHNRVAVHYNLPTINLAKEVTDRIDNNEFNWKDDFKDLHPSPFGQGIYARSMIHFLDNAFAGQVAANAKISLHNIPDKLDEYCYDKGSLIDISTAEISDDWHIDPSWNPNDGTGVRQNYYNVPMLISSDPGSTLKLKFEGKAVGIAVAAGKDAGIIEFRIDNKEWITLNLFTQWSSHLHLPWYYTLSSELPEGEHWLEIKIAEEKDDRSEGQACRIRYFYVNQY